MSEGKSSIQEPGRIGYAAMLGQFHPNEALELAGHAEKHGFWGVMAADQFQPWTPQQGQSSFVWNVLTALGERTKADFGPGVTTPTFRWHPAMVAQASATLAAMYPGRHWLGLGSGEALNEHIVGAYWPEAAERINRMFEAAEIIGKMFAGSIAGRDVKHSGTFYKLESTRLWTMPEVAPQILIAAAGPVTAKRAGRVADGFITAGLPLEKVGGLFRKFSEGAREKGKNPDQMSKVLRLALSWAPTQAEALKNALTEWPNGGMAFSKNDIRSPFEFEQMAKHVRPDDFEGKLTISDDLDVHRQHIQRHIDMGFDRIYLHNVGRNQREWIEVFGRGVLPNLVW